jgi:hypothetical protein
MQISALRMQHARPVYLYPDYGLTLAFWRKCIQVILTFCCFDVSFVYAQPQFATFVAFDVLGSFSRNSGCSRGCKQPGLADGSRTHSVSQPQ